MLAGRTTKAMTVFRKGLKIDPNHKGMRAAMENGDRRKRPAIGWLQRNNPVNAFLGKMRG